MGRFCLGMICAVVAMAQGAMAAAPQGVFALAQMNEAPPGSIYRNSTVTGVTLVLTWSALQPAQNRYTWSLPDREIAAARQAGRQVALSVIPGAYTPNWVYQAGARKIGYQWTFPYGYPLCRQVSFPLPWDAVYLKYWTAFIDQLGRRYAHDPAVTVVKFTGGNAQTPEFLLPYVMPGATTPNTCGSIPTPPLSAWQSAGYTPNALQSAMNTVAQTWLAAFPTQLLAMETGTWGMPPLDNNSQIVPGSTGDTALAVNVMLQTIALAGSRFGAANDALSDWYAWTMPAKLPAGTPLSLQEQRAISTDTTCSMNHGATPCPPSSVAAGMVGLANSAGAEFLEVYLADIQNKSLATPLAGFTP